MSSDVMAKADFRHVVKFSLDEFPYDPPPYNGLAFRCPAPTSIEERYHAFAEEMLDAVGKRYLPVYRMADGEFIFMVGRRAGMARRTPRTWLAEKTAFIRPAARRTVWGEDYPRRTRMAALQRMEEALRCVTKFGYVALYLALRPDHWSEEYHDPVLDWFEARNISLHDANTIPFYMVYALLNGRYRPRLFSGRAVLVVTSLGNAERRSAIEAGLLAEGVASVQFLEISANASMLDQLDLSRVNGSIDLALVAAGIGSVNVLAQLQPLGVPAIDCGIALEAYVDPKRRWERPYLIDDTRISAGELARLRQF